MTSSSSAVASSSRAVSSSTAASLPAASSGSAVAPTYDHQHLKSLRETEHESMVAIIEGLVRCHRQKAYVDLGFQTMWAYISDFLEYAPAAASRRYRAMQCVELCPDALDLLRAKRVNLSVLSKCWSRLKTEDDPRAFLAKIDGKSQREVERILARYAPARALPPERTRPRFVKVGTSDPLAGRSSGHSGGGSSAAEPSSGHPQAPGLFDTDGASSTVEHGPAKSSAAELLGAATTTSLAGLSGASGSDEPTDEPIGEKTVELVEYTFCVPRDLHDQLLKAQAIVSRATGGCPTMFETLEAMTRFFLQHKSPIERQKRRQKRRQKGRRAQANRSTASKPGASDKAAIKQDESKHDQPDQPKQDGTGMRRPKCSEDGNSDSADGPTAGSRCRTSSPVPASPENSRARPCARSRHVPQATRDLVFARDGERCTYVGPDGHRCRATHDLQVDHVVPFAQGGSHEPENLRLLCGAHNRRRNECPVEGELGGLPGAVPGGSSRVGERRSSYGRRGPSASAHPVWEPASEGHDRDAHDPEDRDRNRGDGCRPRAGRGVSGGGRSVAAGSSAEEFRSGTVVETMTEGWGGRWVGRRRRAVS